MPVAHLRRLTLPLPIRPGSAARYSTMLCGVLPSGLTRSAAWLPNLMSCTVSCSASGVAPTPAPPGVVAIPIPDSLPLVVEPAVEQPRAQRCHRSAPQRPRSCATANRRVREPCLQLLHGSQSLFMQLQDKKKRESKGKDGKDKTNVRVSTSENKTEEGKR